MEAQQPWYSPCPLPDQFNKVHLKNRRWTPVLGSWGGGSGLGSDFWISQGTNGNIWGCGRVGPNYMCPVSFWQLEGLLKLPKG